MVNLVEQMIEAKPKCVSAQSDEDKTYFENMCTALDRRNDVRVSELDGSTDEEIAVIEAE